MQSGLHNLSEGFISGTHVTLHVIIQGFVTMEITVGGGGGDALLLETGDNLLLETGDNLLLE